MDHISVVPSKRFIEILSELQGTFGAPESIKQKLLKDSDNSQEIKLTTQEIQWCHTKMRERGIPERIHELLSESQIVLPKYEPPSRNPELEARVQRLRFEQENREYKNMTKSVDLVHQKENLGLGEVGKELKTVNKQIITGAQYLLSIVGTFFAVFIATSIATPDYGIRALLASLSAVIVGLAEIFFIIRDDIKEENKLDKNK